MSDVFTRIVHIDCPATVVADAATGRSPAIEVAFRTDGPVPFPQVILWEGGRGHLAKDDDVAFDGADLYRVTFPAGLLGPGEYRVQVEGCRRADILSAGGGDWIKAFASLRVERAAAPVTGRTAEGVCVRFAIHKHMHQPYYDAVDPRAWDGEKDGIFGSRRGAYGDFIPTAVRHYIAGGLPYAGLGTSFSGSLVEQLERAAAEGLAGGAFAGYRRELLSVAAERTALGHPRVDFTAFGHFHPLMPLIPARDIVRQIELHRRLLADVFGVEASPVLFPPETAFATRMIPALCEAGVEAVIYDSIHRFRACRDYPYAGPREGLLPPNPAEQENPPVSDWLQLHNIWAGSLISPSLLRPELLRYTDPDGASYDIVGVPAERYIGNEDARGGFGALQYASVLGQVFDRIVADGTFDPAHPTFFVLHSDGDNHGGGSDVYYRHNTEQLVRWLRDEPRFELTTIRDYLARFPVDRARAAHVEPGSWSGADNGDPQFAKWFSRYREAYSPDLNSWAVLTALQNLVHAAEDLGGAARFPTFAAAERLLLTAETSCYWYWTGQEQWDRQVTAAANRATALLADALAALATEDRSPPTIFPPWILPENPGGKAWGSGGLVDAPRQGTLHTFIADVRGVRTARVIVRHAGGELSLPLVDRGPYPSRTGAQRTAGLFTADLPVGLGDVRYYVEAVDGAGHVARGALERVYLP